MTHATLLWEAYTFSVSAETCVKMSLNNLQLCPDGQPYYSFLWQRQASTLSLVEGPQRLLMAVLSYASCCRATDDAGSLILSILSQTTWIYSLCLYVVYIQISDLFFCCCSLSLLSLFLFLSVCLCLFVSRQSVSVQPRLSLNKQSSVGFTNITNMEENENPEIKLRPKEAQRKWGWEE